MQSKELIKKINDYLNKNSIKSKARMMKGDIFIIDNLGFYSACEIAESATGLKFEHMTQSMTRIKPIQ